MSLPDPHSHTNPQQARTERICLALRVDFVQSIIQRPLEDEDLNFHCGARSGC